MGMAFPTWASTPLPADAIGLSNVNRIVLKTVFSPSPPSHRPGGPVYEIRSIAVLTATLNGCLDELGPVAVHIERRVDGKLALYLNAVNIERKGSLTTRCYRAPTVDFNVSLGRGVYDAQNIEVVVLQ